MRNYGKTVIALLAVLVCGFGMPSGVMAQTVSAGALTGDETPIIALALCVVGVVIIVVALKKRK